MFAYNIKNNCNCNSIGVVYIIRCTLCDIFYIGETKKAAKNRIREHLYNIRFFKANVIKCLGNLNKCSEVALHFADNKHCVSQHFKFYIFNSNLHDLKTRRSVETEMIQTFMALKVPIVNTKIPSIKYISTYSFSE